MNRRRRFENTPSGAAILQTSVDGENAKMETKNYPLEIFDLRIQTIIVRAKIDEQRKVFKKLKQEIRDIQKLADSECPPAVSVMRVGIISGSSWFGEILRRQAELFDCIRFVRRMKRAKRSWIPKCRKDFTRTPDDRSNQKCYRRLM